MIFEDCNNENLPVQNFLHREGNSQVKNVLKDMAIDVDADTLSKNVLQAFEKLINEVKWNLIHALMNVDWLRFYSASTGEEKRWISRKKPLVCTAAVKAFEQRRNYKKTLSRV